jgi:transcriptional regulator with XRE-family HTH domain
MGQTAHDKAFLAQLGLRVRQAREEHSWSQEDLAANADLHRTYIGGVERGERNVTILSLRRVARSLGKSIHDLIP